MYDSVRITRIQNNAVCLFVCELNKADGYGTKQMKNNATQLTTHIVDFSYVNCMQVKMQFGVSNKSRIKWFRKNRVYSITTCDWIVFCLLDLVFGWLAVIRAY